MIYEPSEDSFLLLKHVKKNSKGVVLDIGTGSAIQALEAAKSKNVVKVYGVDIDKKTIDYCRTNIESKKIEFYASDLFSVFKNYEKLKGIKFDTIIFNPPYLPNDVGVKDIALDGGRKGYELLQRFFIDAKKFLKPNGRMLIVFSSLTDRIMVDQLLQKYKYKFKLLDSEKMAFEELYVYLVENC